MGGCTSKKPTGYQDIEFPILSCDENCPIGAHYDVVVVGSGYGAGVAGSRAARAGQSVCILEKGKEWQPGEFPETFNSARKEIAVNRGGKLKLGHGLSLFDVLICDDVSVVRGCGLGGTSLINANVALEADERLYKHESWPQEFRDDFDNFKTDMQRARDMLRPNVYPLNPEKTQLMCDLASTLQNTDVGDIEDLHNLFKSFKSKSAKEAFFKTPICVNFNKKKLVNHVGVPQPPCNGCGNCVSGCNVGAKNTTDKNYLADAKYHGARIFTKVKVTAIQASEGRGKWSVSYQRFHDGDWLNSNMAVTCDIVILGAGTLGSTEVLLRSLQDNSISLSNQLGKGFSGNGDQIGVIHAADQVYNAMGIKSDFKPGDVNPPGPCITSAIDLRATVGDGPWQRGFILEDGSPPSSSVTPLKVLLALGHFIAFDEDTSDDWQQIAESLTGAAMDKSLPLLAMGYDDVGENGSRYSGDITLTENGLQVTWPETGEKPYYKQIHETYKLLATISGGMYVPNPGWASESLPIFGGRNTITVHPLGGCVMGSDGTNGVVNHKGQVFKGDGSDVHEGLYVMDASVIPHSVAVNPIMTITGVAERCMRLMADDYGWDLDYEFLPSPQNVKWITKPSIKVDEYMNGTFLPAGKNSKQYSLDFRVTLFGKDIEYFLHEDPNRRLQVQGTLRCEALSPKPLTLNGTVDMFVPDGQVTENKKLMLYNVKCRDAETGKEYFYFAQKDIQKNSLLEFGWVDTTHAHVTIYEGTDKTGTVVGEGDVGIGPLDLIKSVHSIQIGQAKTKMLEIKWKAEFLKLFLCEIWQTYSPFSQGLKLNPNAKPREKRLLNLPEAASPTVYRYTTQDDKTMWVTRYQGGTKGPVLLAHGLGISSAMFTLDTIETNFVEYLVSKQYDVWCMEWRGSVVTPYAELPFTVDDVGRYDFPAAVDKVLQISQKKTVQMVAHCVGSQTLFASMLSGQLQGKIRSVTCSQVAFTPISPKMNKIKAGLHLADIADAIGLDTLDDEERGLWYDKLVNHVSKAVANFISPYEEECKSYVDHRLTLIYGRLWNHKNLNKQTHDNLHEVFGIVNVRILKHLARLVREEHIVSFDGKDIYLPDIDQGLASDNYKKHMEYINVPICFTNGTENEVYAPVTMEKSIDLAKEANPEQYYEWLQIEGYGHLETFLGKDAAKISYPKLLTFLDKYAEEQ